MSRREVLRVGIVLLLSALLGFYSVNKGWGTYTRMFWTVGFVPSLLLVGLVPPAVIGFVAARARHKAAFVASLAAIYVGLVAGSLMSAALVGLDLSAWAGALTLGFADPGQLLWIAGQTPDPFPMRLGAVAVLLLAFAVGVGLARVSLRFNPGWPNMRVQQNAEDLD